MLAIEASNNLVSTNHRLVALVGVSDLVVVDSDDVIMILPRDRAGEVKKVVTKLQEAGLEQYL